MAVQDALLRLLRYGGGQFIAYVTFPMLVLLPFGIGTRELRLRPNWRVSLPVGLLWCAPAAILLALGLARGKFGIPELAATLPRNIFSNGFSEEFLMRGVLMSRLENVMPGQWALFVQAVIFGAWHYGADMHGSRGDLWGAAGAMVFQMSFGYAMGFVAMRTGSILVPSVFHTLFDTVGDLAPY